MADFMLLLHASSAPPQFSPDQMQEMVERYAAWTNSLAARGHLVRGAKLFNQQGRVLKKRNDDTTVLDGPYAELKEVVAGYFHLAADDYDQAVELSRDCPHLDFGGTIELRQIERPCEGHTIRD